MGEIIDLGPYRAERQYVRRFVDLCIWEAVYAGIELTPEVLADLRVYAVEQLAPILVDGT
jgi:hypothetical protein